MRSIGLRKGPHPGLAVWAMCLLLGTLALAPLVLAQQGNVVSGSMCANHHADCESATGLHDGTRGDACEHSKPHGHCWACPGAGTLDAAHG